ncbi:MAG: hypothetical protein SVW57_03240 [Thermodesulfobacteriota bacterium]|nr:hypothetical protein [Thermodesulfobacteriota bacterium]
MKNKKRAHNPAVQLTIGGWSDSGSPQLSADFSVGCLKNEQTKKIKKVQKREESHSNKWPYSSWQKNIASILPPYAKIASTGKMAFSSWMNERLPEMIWPALIREALG